MWTTLAQPHALRQLQAELAAGHLSHAYLLVGPPHVGKMSLALDIARAVNCAAPVPERPCGGCRQCKRITAGHHADVLVITLQHVAVQRREISIDEVRTVERQAALKPFEGASRVFIFDSADHMSEEAANALLKTLEEPPPQSLLILLAIQPDLLLPTILSRCRRIDLRPMPQDALARYLMESHQVPDSQAQLLARLSKGCVGWALKALKEPTVLEHRQTEMERAVSLMDGSLEQRFSAASDVSTIYYRDRAAAMNSIHTWLQWWRDLLLVKESAEAVVYNLDYLETLKEKAARYSAAEISAFLAAILDALKAIEANVQPRLALEALMLRMPASHTPKTPA